MLNKKQQEFADNKSLYCLGLAPAGSGKTTTILEMVKNVIENRMSPDKIVLITFTRMAGNELKERAANLMGEEVAKQIFANTIHAFCIKILMDNARYVHESWELHELEYDKVNFSIYDQDDRHDMIKKVISDLNLKITLSDVFMCFDDNSVDTFKKNEPQRYDSAMTAIKEYRSRVFENIALDLDMIITEATRILKENPHVMEHYRKRIKFLSIDEFQDTNKNQIDFVKALNPEYIRAIGDEDQCLYTWRGAENKYILNFSDYFTDAETIMFNYNYRSSDKIIDLARHILRNNTESMHKEIKTIKSGPNFVFTDGEDVQDEATRIIRRIHDLGDEFGECAVLCPQNKIASDIAEVFASMGVPHILISSSNDPFKIKHIKKMFKYMQLATNPRDFIAFDSIINYPYTRVSKEEELRIKSIVQLDETDFITAMRKVSPDLHNLSTQLENLGSRIRKGLKPFDAYMEILSLSGIYGFLSSQGRSTRIAELDIAMKEIEKWQNRYDGTTPQFLRWLMIRDIQDKITKDADGKVKIMTIHASKGLEFKNVFAPSVNDGIFPNDKSDLEEQRRLMHVLITRAKENLMFSYTKTKATRYNKSLFGLPSEFYTDLKRYAESKDYIEEWGEE